MAPCCLSVVLLHLCWIFSFLAVAVLSRVIISETAYIPSNRDVTFYIYPTSSMAETPVPNDVTAILPSHPLTMVFHGFKGDLSARSMQALKEALLANGVQNVVVVDWGPLADAPDKSPLTAYQHVRDNGVQLVANTAAQWLQYVMEYNNITHEQVHLIGFSLGAHVTGIIGHLFNSTLSKITGLDPPKFGYDGIPEEQRLDASDALFVNVIHTTPGILSYAEAIGHVDFYPNGDRVPQPGCPSESPLHIITCSHYFSFALFAESLFNQNAFVATECDSWQSFTKGECSDRIKVPMGYSTPTTTRGKFFMKTGNGPPFGNDDSASPLPQKIISLLAYNKSDSIFNTRDVVNFLKNKGSEAETSEILLAFSGLTGETQGDTGSNVMKVKSSRYATTTPDPPAFISGSPQYQSYKVVLFCLAGIHFLRLYSEMNTRYAF